MGGKLLQSLNGPSSNIFKFDKWPFRKGCCYLCYINLHFYFCSSLRYITRSYNKTDVLDINMEAKLNTAVSKADNVKHLTCMNVYVIFFK